MLRNCSIPLRSRFDALVVTQEQIFNEFSGGVTDPSAIRDFLKYLWDRALAQGQQLPEHLLLFGDATFDTKNIKSGFTNYVITFQSSESIHRTNSYGTDDYFAYMDDGEEFLALRIGSTLV